ncbi:MAG: collagen-like protein [Symploca sp. SIO2C1]|nr:collagen-like protein [Symploca sp. SIO2C1]
MPIRFLSKLSLFLVFLALPNFLSTSSESGLCPLLAWDGQEREYGNDGRDGNIGRKGRQGRDGQSLTVFADGSPMNLQLSGEDGLDGEDGRNGSDARCRNQNWDVDYNLRGADGGNGGNGGDGGDGGNGGSLTIHYNNLADLRSIYVRAEGGRAGRPGRSGYGAEGCQCRKRDWEETTCTGTPGTPDYSCKTEEFSCRDGKDGKDGRDGRDGNLGRLGTLAIINSTEPLSPDQPTATVAMSQLQDRLFTLSKNKWQTKTGAISLLAPGSIIDNQYREFVERIESSFELVWNAPRSIRDFPGQQNISLALQDNRQVKVDFPEEVWVEGTTSQQEGVTQFIVSNAIHQKEVTQLTRADFSGNGTNLSFSLVDKAGKSNLVATQFWIKYRTARTRPGFRRTAEYRTKYEGNIPEELVSRHNNHFTLNLGKLPIESRYLKPGVAVDIDLVATRSFAGRSTEQKIDWKGEIRRR